MSLPPGFLDELRTRTSLSQVVGRKVMWDMRKSNQGKGDMWAPCPFHHEKTASFHVDDKQGFYYCFGCHAKGDAISFIRETENVGFMEAVEILARESGMQMPARDPKAQEKADRRSQLAEVMEQAVQFYKLQLKTAAAAEARDYLARRGLGAEALDRWDIGFASDNRRNVIGHLTGKNVPEQTIIDAGLAARPDDGGPSYDRFRGRIIFPIRDAQGRAIALGGRAMDPNARAKYLNSPETELFDKGRSLYNQGPARTAAGKGQPLIVAEGYMDVIALSEAGFGATVAPLGTAITEDQLQLLWRIHPEPIIALDGDTAGLRAAMRLIDLALPMLSPDHALRFCLLPEGKDPDDLLRADGAGAMQALLDEAKPLVSLLWQRETEGKVLDSPERRAALDKSLRAALGRIADQSLRSHYADEIRRLRSELFNPPRKEGQRREWRKQAVVPLSGTKSSFLVAGGNSAEERLREAVILATLITHPALLPQFEGELERLEFSDPEYRAIATALIRHGTDADDLRAVMAEKGLGASLEKLFAQRHVRIAPGVRDTQDAEKATMCVAMELAKLSARRGFQREVAEAMHDMDAVADEGLTWRLSQAADARNRAERSQTEDRAHYDLGDNGAQINRDERTAFEQLLDRIDYSKGRRTRR
ncbi:MAG: DNA primase [Rhodobacteraceae bacterium]|nr:DNA primase [Paracoccaceae bacterium]